MSYLSCSNELHHSKKMARSATSKVILKIVKRKNHGRKHASRMQNQGHAERRAVQQVCLVKVDDFHKIEKISIAPAINVFPLSLNNVMTDTVGFAAAVSKSNQADTYLTDITKSPSLDELSRTKKMPGGAPCWK